VKHLIAPRSSIITAFSIAFVIYSCSKGGGETPPNPCAGVTVTVSGTTTNPTAPGATDGNISVSATGGSGFTFSINGGAFQSSGSFAALAGGSYTITAKNSSGCTGSSSFTLTAANPCAGVTITVTGTVTNPASTIVNNGSIVASAAGSTGFTYRINGGAYQASGNFTNLGVGSYTIDAKDANGCTGTASFTLTAPNPCAGVTITVTGTVTNPTSGTSNNGSITASAAGSTGFTYRINNGAFQASGTFSNLGAGTFTVDAKDANGCTGSSNFTLTAPNPCAGVTISVSTVVTGTIPCEANNGTITVTPSGGTAAYTFSLNGGAFQVSNIFSGLGANTYTITAKDANGCTGTGSATINNLAAGPLFLAARTVLQNNCTSCHNNTLAEGGMNWTIDCNIVQNKDRIRVRAVDGVPSPMPPTGLLPATERQKITDWINAGGKFTN
jgi:adhesin HecA-like repeat protein